MLSCLLSQVIVVKMMQIQQYILVTLDRFCEEMCPKYRPKTSITCTSTGLEEERRDHTPGTIGGMPIPHFRVLISLLWCKVIYNLFEVQLVSLPRVFGHYIRVRIDMTLQHKFVSLVKRNVYITILD